MLIGNYERERMFNSTNWIAIEKHFNWDVITHNYWFENGKIQHNSYVIRAPYTVMHKYKKIVEVDFIHCDYDSNDNNIINVHFKFQLKKGKWSDYDDINFYLFVPYEDKYEIKYFDMKTENDVLDVKFSIDISKRIYNDFFHYYEIVDNHQNILFDYD